MGNCLHCKKEMEEYTGRRPKSYCSDNCRQKAYQTKVKAQKYMASLQDERKKRSNPLVNAARGRDINGVNADELKLSEKESNRDEILDQIKAIKAEKIPANRDTTLGRKSWTIDQNKRIQELENQLKNL